LVEWTEVRAVKKGASLVFRDSRRVISFGIRGIGVAIVNVEVRRNIRCGLGSESEKWELIVRNT